MLSKEIPAAIGRAFAQALGSSFPSASPAASAAPPGADNIAACKTYVAAFNNFRHSKGDGLAVGATFDAQLAAADAEATGHVKADLDATQAGMTELLGGGTSDALVRAAEQACGL